MVTLLQLYDLKNSEKELSPATLHQVLSALPKEMETDKMSIINEFAPKICQNLLGWSPEIFANFFHSVFTPKWGHHKEELAKIFEQSQPPSLEQQLRALSADTIEQFLKKVELREREVTGIGLDRKESVRKRTKKAILIFQKQIEVLEKEARGLEARIDQALQDDLKFYQPYVNAASKALSNRKEAEEEETPEDPKHKERHSEFLGKILKTKPQVETWFPVLVPRIDWHVE